MTDIAPGSAPDPVPGVVSGAASGAASGAPAAAASAPMTGAGRGRADRLAGVLLLALAAVAAWLARGYRVAFIADPIGPRAFPLLAAALVALGAAWLAWRPAADRAWPAGAARRRLGLAVGVLAVYPLVLPLLGFITATGAALWALALLFGGPALRGGAAAILVAGGMYLLFVYALGVPLPIGLLFLARPA